ncbi:cytochrome oxidase putative small subunit CydP [Acinetobacter sp. MD2(2019)]|uniref:cytochrome oxidase putative small subunit CydP n=1 Tax=Acinetobacter sp. MD2(2019) TaxID=2605273 RepID=UPI002D1E6727|nr:cytochrome oxidase putative small subunit CydP [Acinetobacter sp. MD2(2019)]MEB3752932.1 hypothetical protein [Acinetobacter sp. MD2(2019)]
MGLKNKTPNQKLSREIAIILVIKVAVLMLIKSIWFNSPTIPKDFNTQTAQHISGNSSETKETR